VHTAINGYIQDEKRMRKGSKGPSFSPYPPLPIPLSLLNISYRMASDQQFADFILAQIQFEGLITSKKMFGEYGLFADGKIFGMICDNKLFIKPTEAGRKYIGEVVEASPYEGAKPAFLIEEKMEDREWLSELVKRSLPELPEPKRKKKR
jgi:TfoX/Sxy family transcriptional regulator of competence genes